MNSVAWCALAIIACVFSVILKKCAPEFVPLVTVCAGIMLLLATLSVLTPFFSFVQQISQKFSLNEQTKLLLKLFGISLLMQWCCDVCRDLGEQSLATQLELLGKAEILILLLPTLQEILAFSSELLL